MDQFLVFFTEDKIRSSEPLTCAINQGDYLRELFRLYGDEMDAPAEPQLPEWCFDEEDEDDDPGGRGNNADEGKPRNRRQASHRRISL